jgi:triosephosphate isomerase
MLTIAVSLKAYFGFHQTVSWCETVAELAVANDVVGRRVRLIVLPAFPALAAAVQVFKDTAVEVGAQAISVDEPGAHTGEVPAEMLAEVGCCCAEIGHAERRDRFGETESVVRAKVAAATRAGLAPLLCVGEQRESSVDEALRSTTAQIDAAGLTNLRGRAPIVAYEPVWAIGMPKPAPAQHVQEVCLGLSEATAANEATVIYGGSAGPGTLSTIFPAAAGLFLGRFAHDPARLRDVLDEATALAGTYELCDDREGCQ